MDSPVPVENGQSATVNERGGVELVETESPDDAREPEPHMELSISSAVVQTLEDGCRPSNSELTVQGVPETDFSYRGRHPKQRKPPSCYGT